MAIIMISMSGLWWVEMCALCSDYRDTAGQERFRTITTAYYRGAMVSLCLHVYYTVKIPVGEYCMRCKSVLFSSFPLCQGIMLVYDITSEKSFDNIKNWIRNIEEVSFGHQVS